jgi:hypothetical protein
MIEPFDCGGTYIWAAFCSLILDLTRGTCGKGCTVRIVPNHSAFAVETRQ